MSMTITRPNGTTYRPRAIRCVPLCEDEDSPVDAILVLGTHDLSDARARAEAALRVEAEKQGEVFGVTLRLSDEPGQRGWWARKFWGFFEDWPLYTYPEAPETGAAGVKFAVVETDNESPPDGGLCA